MPPAHRATIPRKFQSVSFTIIMPIEYNTIHISSGSDTTASLIMLARSTNLGLFEAGRAVLGDDGQFAGLGEVAQLLLPHVDQRTDHPQVLLSAARC